MRKAEFKAASKKPLTIVDSRFGIRRMFLNKQERPRIAVNTKPGRGPNGEHQS
jgi:hypothetical protein